MAKTDIFPPQGIFAQYPLNVIRLPGVIRETGTSGRVFQRQRAPSRRLLTLEFDLTTEQLMEIQTFYNRLQARPFVFRHGAIAQGSWNLLGLDAEAEHSGTASGGFYWLKYDGGDIEFPLGKLGLKVGDILSLSGEIKTSAAGGESGRIDFEVRDKDLGFLATFSTTTEAGTSYNLHKRENFTIPANTVFFRVLGVGIGGTSETKFIRRVKINRGTTALEFEAPFTTQELVPRFFPVTFASEPRWPLERNESNRLTVQLVEAVGEDLLEVHYPDPLDYENSGDINALGEPGSYFKEEDDPDAAVVAGTWSEELSAVNHAGRALRNNGTDTSHKFRFTYFGYGCRIYSRKTSSLGIVEVFHDDVSLGNVDLYDAGGLSSAPILAKLDVALGLHTVELKPTNTKNASSSNFFIYADAIEVIR